jgi:(5-formylfuran-3-yl)methyl phosphate synthase
VSVRSPGEVRPALDGGADIVDAKDPARGALGAVEPALLARVLERVPPATPFSAALGDPLDVESAVALIDALSIPPRAAPSYVKLGFAGASDRDGAERMLGAAVGAARRHPARPLVIAVVYADEPTAVGLDRIVAAASRSGASGVLVDTMQKSGGSLLDAVSPDRLTAWIAEARAARLLVAVAGRLDSPEIKRLAGSGADVVGVRGAACDGGRGGEVSAAKVRVLRNLLDEIAEARRPAAKHQSDAGVAAAVSARK